jgi:hypothetical protein
MVNEELKIMKMEAVAANFEGTVTAFAWFDLQPVRIDSSGRDSSPEPPEYEAGISNNH